MDSRAIDLLARLRQGRSDVLIASEIESLVEAMGRRRSARDQQSTVVSIRKRRAARSKDELVNLDVKYNRISSAADYLQWYIPRLAYDHGCGNQLIHDQALKIAAHLRNLRPRRSRFQRLGLRMGLSDEALLRLLEIVDVAAD